MEILDFREGALVSRLNAADDLKKARAQIRSGRDVLVDLGSNLAMTSWVDGFLVHVARDVPELIIVTSSDVTRNHLVRVFSSRGVHARVSRTRADALRGEFDRIPAA
jgi:hypothetical protein